MILSLSHPQDAHVFAVQEALRRKGHDMTIWYTTDLAQMQNVSLDISDESALDWRIESPGWELTPKPVSSLWMRRAEAPVVGEEVHPSDRPFAEAEYSELLRWMIAMLPRDVFWVNRQERRHRVRSKIEQQRVARKVGLRIPKSLYGNDPDRIRDFLRQQGGRLAYKSFNQQGPWVMGDWGFAYLYTSVVTEEHLREDQALRAAPGIYQELVPKDYELRITVIGRRVFPTKIDSQAVDEGKVDWRFAQHEMHYEPVEIPAQLERGILAMMEEFDLAYGAFDFILTPEGQYVFLEVNEAGQFLFAEHETGVPLLDAFCELLIQGRVDYVWDPAKATIRYLDFAELALARLEEGKAEHPDPPGRHSGIEEAAAEARVSI